MLFVIMTAMNEERHIKILSFVGLTGSGKSSAVHYLAERGYPKVIMDPDGNKNPANIDEATKQIHGIADSGQRKCVIDGPNTWQQYKQLKRTFPGEMTTIAITTTRYIRHQRLAKRAENTLSGTDVDHHDYEEIEKNNIGGVIAIADYFVANNGSSEQLHVQLDDLVRKIDD